MCPSKGQKLLFLIRYTLRTLFLFIQDKDSYQEIHHKLNHYPDMVTVQTMIGNTGFMSDGIGKPLYICKQYQ